MNNKKYKIIKKNVFIDVVNITDGNTDRKYLLRLERKIELISKKKKIYKHFFIVSKTDKYAFKRTKNNNKNIFNKKNKKNYDNKKHESKFFLGRNLINKTTKYQFFVGKRKKNSIKKRKNDIFFFNTTKYIIKKKNVVFTSQENKIKLKRITKKKPLLLIEHLRKQENVIVYNFKVVEQKKNFFKVTKFFRIFSKETILEMIQNGELFIPIDFTKEEVIQKIKTYAFYKTLKEGPIAAMRELIGFTINYKIWADKDLERKDPKFRHKNKKGLEEAGIVIQKLERFLALLRKLVLLLILIKIIQYIFTAINNFT